MKKKYLKTVEDVVALKDTDTKIYAENVHGYYQFVSGIWCAFDVDGEWSICPLTCKGEELYILEEEYVEQQEVTKDDFGKLCWFWYDNCVFGEKEAGILDHIEGENYRTISGFIYANCKRMTPAEVAEITGYGVTEDGSTFYGEPFKVVGKEK